MSRIKHRSLHFIGIFTAVVVFASLVNAVTLYGQSLRLDEAQSIWVATKPLSTILSLTSQDVHVPLYNTLLHFWIQIFGSDIHVVRTMSFLFFIATLPVLYLFAREASTRNVALVTIIFFAFSPFILWYSSEARMYTLFTFATSLNHLFFLRLLRSDGAKGKAGYILSLVLGFYTHYFFLFLVMTQGVYLVVRTLRNAIRKKTYEVSLVRSIWLEKRLPLLVLGLLIIAGFFFLPWIIYVIANGTASNTQPQIPAPTSFNLLQTFVNFIFGFQAQGIQSILISLWPFSVLILFIIFTRRKKVEVQGIDYMIFATFVPVLIVFLISFIRSIFLSRYLILVTPTLFFLLAWVVMHYSRKVAGAVIIGFLALTFGLMLYQNTSSQTPVREDYKAATLYLSQKVRPVDIILVSAPFTVYPIEYYYQGRARITTIPVWNRYAEGGIPAFSVNDLDTQMKKYAQTYVNAYVVLSYDQGYEKQIRKYLDGYQLLAKKQFSPGLEIREYKLNYDRE